jgi:hypothetical protein
MTTLLDKTLKRELTIEGRAFIVAMSPDGIKITLKGKRNGQELRWRDLVSGDAALAVALNASVGKFAVPTKGVPVKAVPGKAVPGKAVPGKAVPGKAVPVKPSGATQKHKRRRSKIRRR